MRQYVTHLSKHCYYGNVTWIINSYGILVSEGELVLLSNALNLASLLSEERLYVGISQDNCSIGLKKLGCYLETVDSLECEKKLAEAIPILLLIRSNCLKYNYTYAKKAKSHYIVALKKEEDKLLISDSFIQTIPKTIFHGWIPLKDIYDEIVCERTKNLHIAFVEKNYIIEKEYESMIRQYIDDNLNYTVNSSLCVLKQFVQNIITCKDRLKSNDVLANLAYDIKYSGCVARFDYLEELMKKYFKVDETIINELQVIKKKWGNISNRLMKYAITLKVENAYALFYSDIPELIGNEENLYRRIEEAYLNA